MISILCLQLESLISRLHVETRIKEGAENLLQVLESESRHDGKELAKQVAAELQTSKTKIANINRKLEEVRESMPGKFPRQSSTLVILTKTRPF